jgi:predicted ester cyclase
MSTEDNKATVRRGFEEVWNQGKVAVVDELCVPHLICHEPMRPDVRTLEDYKRYITEVRSLFPDIHFTLEDMIAEGEQVVVRYMWRGTNTGELVGSMMRLPATGKQVTVTGMSINRFAEGKVVEIWIQLDSLGMFQQLGLIPMPQPVG